MNFPIIGKLGLPSKKKILIVLSLVFGAVFLYPHTVLAQDPLGLQYAEQIGLSAADPRIMAANIVRVLLGFLGILAVCLIIYGGFLWMTSAGNPEQIDRAKKVLKNAIIGLILIFASFGIASFVIRSLMDSFGTGDPTPTTPSTPGGISALGTCSVDYVYPSPGQRDVPRNTSIMITFKEEVDPSTICQVGPGEECSNDNIHADGRIRIFRNNEGYENYMDEVVVYQTPDNKTFQFYPVGYLGSPSESLWYGVYMDNSIQGMNEEGIFSECHNQEFSWDFEVSTELDLTPPQVESIFPPPDDEQDEVIEESELSQATGSFDVISDPHTHEPATLNSSVAIGGSPDEYEVDLDENCTQDGDLLLSISPEDRNVALLRNETSGTNLGASQFQGNTVSFSGILDFTVTDGDQSEGDSWRFNVESRQDPDTISVNSDVYTFVSSGSGGNLIEIEEGNLNQTGLNIASALSSRGDLNAGWDGDSFVIEATTGGSAGNNIIIESSNSDAVVIEPMSGGEDAETVVEVRDRPDQPMNAIIEIHFNEAISPITVSGPSEDVYSTIRVINNQGSERHGDPCGEDSDCRSFNCEAGLCSGNSLAGRFIVSNAYQTLEFQSDNRCGVNACGMDIYCLPEESNIKIEIEAALLHDCGGDDAECARFSPFGDCIADSDASSGDHVCYDEDEEANYPMACLNSLHGGAGGVVDAANNSLDGNRDGKADGPVDYYDENIDDPDQDGDSYTWSFWTSDELRIQPPEMISLNPSLGEETENLVDPVEIGFDVLMRSSTLSSGGREIDTGQEVFYHRLINMWDVSGGAFGYWITNEGIDDDPVDGYPNRTNVLVNHSMFSEAVTYAAQVGSGVEDIYQNCYKPSDGPDCDSINEALPSCCYGVETGAESCD